MQKITSTQNPIVRLCRALQTAKGRQSEGLYLVEGWKMAGEAVQSGQQIVSFLVETESEQHPLVEKLEQMGAEGYSISSDKLASAADTKTPQGILCLIKTPQPKPLEVNRIVVLDGLQDPGNCGTIWRTADAAGFEGMLFGEGSADPFSPKVVRSTMGSIFRVPCERSASLGQRLAQLRKEGYAIVVSSLQGGPFFEREELGPKVALAIGSEARGICEAVRQQATHEYKLPMLGGAESLNAAVAAGIMMYDFVRRSW